MEITQLEQMIRWLDEERKRELAHGESSYSPTRTARAKLRPVPHFTHHRPSSTVKREGKTKEKEGGTKELKEQLTSKHANYATFS